MNISVIGLGYVGLVTGVCLAGKGHNVTCVDIDKQKVQQINTCESPLYETGLQELLARRVSENKLNAYSNFNEVGDTEVIFLCIGTPCNSHGSIDLTYLECATSEIGSVLANSNNHPVIALRSTVPPGTTEKVVIPLLEESSGKRVGYDFSVALNPEFLQEGKALQDFLNPDKIVIGEYDSMAGDTLEKVYDDFSTTIIRTDLKTAEMIKLANNAFLATKISFINEVGNLCKKFGIDIYEVAEAIGHDPRIGRMFLNAGIGFGGSCLPKDLSGLISVAKANDCETNVLESVLDVNRHQVLKMLEIARQRLGTFRHKTVAVLGLAFKPETDDVREAPAIKAIFELLAEGAIVKAYDPLAIANAQRVLPPEVESCQCLRQAIDNSDCVLICTDWDEFKDESLYTGKLVIDGRRVLDPDKAKKICRYEGVCW